MLSSVWIPIDVSFVAVRLVALWLSYCGCVSVLSHKLCNTEVLYECVA